jgi:hypothetical protein
MKKVHPHRQDDRASSKEDAFTLLAPILVPIAVTCAMILIFFFRDAP